MLCQGRRSAAERPFEAQEFADKAPLDKNGKPVSDVLAFPDLLSMNLARRDPETGEISFNQHVAEAAVMAALEWMMKQHGRRVSYLDNEEVAKKSGLPRDFPVSGEMRTRAMAGPNTQQVLDEMSRIMETPSARPGRR